MPTYPSYLRLPELLELQSPLGSAASCEERLFIVVHQVFELWFKVLVDALKEARGRLLAGELPGASRRLGRVISLQRLMITQVELLETMSFAEFSAFRDDLGQASGFQSVQYREVEYLSGAKDRAYLRRARWLSEGERSRLERRLAEPSVWDGYLEALRSRGLPVGSPEQIIASVAATAADERGYGDLWTIAENLRTYDALAASWRLRHVQLTERYIGTADGTGGSGGAAYLRNQVDRRYYPLLWRLNPQERLNPRETLTLRSDCADAVHGNGRALSPGAGPSHLARPAMRDGVLR